MLATRARGSRRGAALVGALWLLGACSGSPDSETGPTPTGAACPPESMLTYETFGQSFMERYCTRCHAQTVTGSSRLGAPNDHNFDTLAAVRTHAVHIDEHAAAGPLRVNTSMPPSEPRPTTDERFQLGAWIACGLP